MTSKFGMAGGIPERRVRPIWDAIDSRQFKNALKHSATLLSKYPNSPYALALKALILERMGKSEEAFSVSLNAKELLFKNDPILIDDLTLSTLQIVFQRLDHLDVATSCYEYACGKFANNLELMMGLFSCYVREYAFVKQQQIAIRMYKIVSEERYLLWAVCSIQLQVFWGNGGDKLLLLAEGLLKKHIASHSLHEPEALTVYISVLEQQSKYGDALEVISGKLGSLMVIEVDKLRVQGNFLARAGDFSAAADIFKKVLDLCPDDWECFLHYLDCLLEDNSSWLKDSITDSIYPPKSIACKCELSEDLLESRVSDASAFVQKLAAELSNDNIRCPYLATLEIERRKLLFGKGDVCALIDSLLNFSSRFGHLTCFSSDVEAFLQILPPDKKIEILVKLKKNIESLATTPSKLLGHSITLFKIRESVGDMFNLPSTDLEDFAVEMVEMYCKNLPLSKDLDIQESMHGEELLTMACNILVQLYWRTRDLGYLLESIMILEFGLTIRRHVSQYKILLLHLYSHWGATSLAYEWYKSLEVKNILLETVLHHILPQMLISTHWVHLDDILGDYLRFMDDHLRESADLTSLAYRHRNYSKVIEIVRFKERLQRSSQYLMSKLELSILQMKQNSDTIEEEEHVIESLKHGVEFDALSSEIGSQSLTFNEDLQLRPWWTPTYDKNYLLGPFDGISYCPRENLEDQVKESRINCQKTMEKRSLIPRLVYLSVQCAAASSSVKEKLESNGSSSATKISLEMKILLDRYANILGFPFHDAVELASGVSSGQNSFEAFGSNTADWINFAVFLNAWNLNDSKLVLQDKTLHKPDTWHLVNSLLEKHITQKLKSTGPILSTPGSDLPIIIQLITEPLSWHGLIIQSCIRSSQPPGKKKKKGGPAEHLNPQILHDARDSVKTVCDLLEEVTKWLRQQIHKPVDEDVETLVFPLKGKDKNCGGPGRIFSVVENFVSSMHEFDLGERISRELRSWCSIDVARKLVGGQNTDLNDFLRICDLKLKSLWSLKVQI